MGGKGRECSAIGAAHGSAAGCWDLVAGPNERSMMLDRAVVSSVHPAASRAALAAGLVGSLALLPVAWAQGSATRRRVPRLPAAKPPYQGSVPGTGAPIRVLAIGESTICGIGVARGDETVTAATARALARSTGRPVAWRAHGLSGATARDGLGRLLPHIAPEPGGPSHRCLLRQRRDRRIDRRQPSPMISWPS